MQKVAKVLKLAVQRTKAANAKKANAKAIRRNMPALKKFAALIIKHPELAHALKKTAGHVKAAAAVEPKFTLDQTLAIIGKVAGVMCKKAHEKKANDEATVDRVVKLVQSARSKLGAK